MLAVTRDTWPATRVDLIELFSRHLSDKLALTWLMPREAPGPAATFVNENGEIVRLSSKRAGRLANIQNNLLFFWLNIRSSGDVVSGKYDIVQVRDAVLSAMLFLSASLIARRPFFYWMSFPMAEGFAHRARNTRGGNVIKRSVQWLYGTIGAYLLYRVVMPLCAHIFVQSEQMKRDVIKTNPRLRSNITAVPMGVSTSVYNPKTVEPSKDPRLRARETVVYLGSMDKIREIETLVEACASVSRNWPRVLLLLIGEASPEERKPLLDTAARLGFSDGLMFTGRLPLGEALRYVRAATVCVSPIPLVKILLPGSPTKLIEYLAMARPVVANDHPDQKLVIEQSGAGLCVPYTAGSFAEAISMLLSDRPGAESMAASGPAWVKANRDYAALAALTLDTYNAAVVRFYSRGSAQ